MRRDHGVGTDGFTLLELVLALSLVALVCIGLYAVYDGTLRVVETMDRAAGQDEVTRTVTLLMRNDLLSAYHRKWGEQPQDSPLRFLVPSKGGRRQDPRDARDVVVLEFAAGASPLFEKATDVGRITRIVYALRQAPDHSGNAALVRKELPFAEMGWRTASEEPWRELVIAEAVTSLDIKAYDFANTELAAWDSLEMERQGRPVLPAAITIQFQRSIDDQAFSWSTSISLPPTAFAFDQEPS